MHRPMTRAAALARNPSCSTTRFRRSSGVLACLLLAACAVTGSPLSALEGDPKPAPKKEPAKPAVTRAKSATAPAGAVAAVPDLLQRRRRSIAEVLESHHYLRGMISGGAAKIVDARLAGPFEVTGKRFFWSETSTETMYCATAKLMVPIPSYPFALIRVEHPPEGGERMRARIGYAINYEECRNVEYKPFPELEQLRVQRRRALGHAD
jgi:hypothetical protein